MVKPQVVSDKDSRVIKSQVVFHRLILLTGSSRLVGLLRPNPWPQQSVTDGDFVPHDPGKEAPAGTLRARAAAASPRASITVPSTAAQRHHVHPQRSLLSWAFIPHCVGQEAEHKTGLCSTLDLSLTHKLPGGKAKWNPRDLTAFPFKHMEIKH